MGAQIQPESSTDHVAAMREFNRFYTRHLGLLDQAHLDSPFSLAGARVLYELAHWSETHADANDNVLTSAWYAARQPTATCSRRRARPAANR